MKAGSKVEVVRESNGLFFGQVIDVLEVVSQYEIKIQCGHVVKNIPVSDVRGIDLRNCCLQ